MSAAAPILKIVIAVPATAAAHHRRPSLATSSSSSSSTSSNSSSSTSEPNSLIKVRERRSSPLKRQMSLTTSSDPSIDPHRSHAGGPLATIYSVRPDRDPLLGGSNASPGRIFAGPVDTEADAAPTASPGRNLLSAFQAVSPSRPNVASLLSGGGSAVGLRSAGTNNALQPASPIASPQRRTSSYHSTSRRGSISASPGRSINWASDAMRVANGATVSPATAANRQAGPTVASSANGSPARAVHASPRKQGGVVYSPVKQADQSTGWQIYRDPPTSSRMAGNASTSTISLNIPQANIETLLQADYAEDIENDENEPYDDENSAPAAVPSLPLPTPRSANAVRVSGSATSLTQRRSRRSTLSNVLGSMDSELPLARDRERTPPMAGRSAADVFGTPLGQTVPEAVSTISAVADQGYEPETLASEDERRKRRRISDVE